MKINQIITEGSLNEFVLPGGGGSDNYGGDLHDILMAYISRNEPELLADFGEDEIDSVVADMVTMGMFDDIDPNNEEDLEYALDKIIDILTDDLPEQQGVAEMDSQQPTGRIKSDGTRSHSTYGSRDHYNLGDPETTLGPDSVLTKKDVAKKAVQTLDKAFGKSHKKGMAEGLNEFAPPGSNDSGNDGFSEETLKRLAAQWYNGDEDPRVERTLMAAGWEIGQDEGYDDEPGVFVVQAGDINGNSYISWPAHELKQGVAEGLTYAQKHSSWSVHSPKKNEFNTSYKLGQEKEARAHAERIGGKLVKVDQKGHAIKAKKGVAEGNPNQQLALYKPDSKTYRGQPVPGSDTVDPDDITARRRRADSFSHRDVDKSQTAHDPEQTAHQDQLKRMFDRMLQDLPPRMKQFVYLRYHHDMTLDQVAQRLGIATETARQIEAKMLRKLKGKHGDELRKAAGAPEPAPTAVQITNKDAYAQGQADAQRGVRYNSEKFLPRDKESYRLGYLVGYKK